MISGCFDPSVTAKVSAGRVNSGANAEIRSDGGRNAEQMSGNRDQIRASKRAPKVNV